MSKSSKPIAFAVDRDARNKRRRALRRVQKTHFVGLEEGGAVEKKRDYETCVEYAEGRQIVAELATAFISTTEFYKSDQGGAKPHDEAVKQALKINERRRGYVQGLHHDKVDWGHIAAIAEVSLDDSLSLWTRIREAADDELETSKRAAEVAGGELSLKPYALAQFLAIRDAFADQWKPQGGIESAMIDMLTVSYSLQMYWTSIAHKRAVLEHDDQYKGSQHYKDKRGYDSNGWRSPYQYVGDAIDQAYRLADGYNRQFLRVLRQLRDLRRYAPVVIQNNGGQVNVAANGGQQVNLGQS